MQRPARIHANEKSEPGFTYCLRATWSSWAKVHQQLDGVDNTNEPNTDTEDLFLDHGMYINENTEK